VRHTLLKFNYAVEIGARLAYLGHYRVTKDPNVLEIANDELSHRQMILIILSNHNQSPSRLFNAFFTVVGTIIQYLCLVSPRSLLNIIAQIMEIFAVFSYNKLAKLYPGYHRTFEYMSDAESRHEKYFKQLRAQ
jgi:rubrerythrin